MPYGIRKTRKGCYSVYNKKTARVFSKCSNKKNAYRQSKLLRAIMFNPNFKVNPKPQPPSKGKQRRNTSRSLKNKGKEYKKTRKNR